VQSTTFPSKVQTPVEVFIKGRKVQIRGETNLENTWDVTFYNTKDMSARKSILEWMDIIHYNQWFEGGNSYQGALDSIVSGIKNIMNDPFSLLNQGMNKYQKNIKVEQLDGYGNITYTCELIGAFPINVSSIELDDSNSEVSKTTVTFAFTDIKYSDKSTLSAIRDIAKGI
jgi:hypothetical protein